MYANQWKEDINKGSLHIILNVYESYNYIVPEALLGLLAVPSSDKGEE